MLSAAVHRQGSKCNSNLGWVQFSLQAVLVAHPRLAQRGLYGGVPAFFLLLYPFVVNYSGLSAGYAREEILGWRCFHKLCSLGREVTASARTECLPGIPQGTVVLRNRV